MIERRTLPIEHSLWLGQERVVWNEARNVYNAKTELKNPSEDMWGVMYRMRNVDEGNKCQPLGYLMPLVKYNV